MEKCALCTVSFLPMQWPIRINSHCESLRACVTFLPAARKFKAAFSHKKAPRAVARGGKCQKMSEKEITALPLYIDYKF